MGRTSRILAFIGLWIISTTAVTGVLPATLGVAAAESARTAQTPAADAEAEVAIGEATTVAADPCTEGRKTFDGTGGIRRGRRACDSPTTTSAVTAIVDCTQGGVVVFLTNDAATELTYDVVTATNGASPVTSTVVVPAAAAGPAEIDWFVPVPSGSSLHVVVTSEGVVELDRTFDAVCPAQRPTATIESSCATDGAAVILSNPSADTAVLTILVDGVAADYHVPPFASMRVVIPIAEDASAELTVSHDGATVVSEVVGRDCEQPAVATALDCANQAVAVSLTNGGENTAVLSIVIDGDTVFTVPVEPGGPGASALLPLTEDRPTQVRIEHRGDGLSDETLTLDCEQPRIATTAADCANGQVVVAVANDGERATAAEVTKNGVVAATVSVPAGATTLTAVPFAEDERAMLAIADDPAAPIGVVLDCVEVQAAVVQPSAPAAPATPQAAPSAPSTPSSNDTGPTLRPSGDGSARVLGLQIARTGSSSLLLTEIASLLLGLGALLLVVARRTT